MLNDEHAEDVSDADLDRYLADHQLALPADERENVLATMRFLKRAAALVARFVQEPDEAKG